MAQQPGVLTVQLLFAKDLKDGDLFGKQDPYAKLTVGNQTFRSKTHNRGGKNPVWNETFRFTVINENTLEVTVWDEDMVSDDKIGWCNIDLAKVRTTRKEHLQQAVMRPKSGKQQGFISMELAFEPNSALAKPGAGAPQPAPYPYGAPTAAPAPGYAAAPPPKASGQQPPAGYPGAYSYSGPPGHAPPPAAAASASYTAPGYPAAPPGYPGAPPPGYPQAAAGAPPPGYQGAPPAGYPGAPPPGYPGAPPPGYPGGPPAGYPGAGGYPPAPYAYPPAPSGYGGYPPPAGYGGPTQVVVQRPAHRPHGGMGGGAGLAMGMLGGLGAGLFIADMADGDLFDAGF
eukprot:CAMPEP_0202865554 /NCGR_PEP_ID=MMETSP1391-20130828/6227_1 /ASSEMBLY_ACC=CAM_ASM_000867 /TAXON_ID=1034604 /ORGANISM="Chlamydomonas leiostraca, Strain SAG 11-49" /LENGTH=341 /DNA_ID=CAMNT_0049545413 /DNA_START=102 /DNA_END=1127 /DNA_ORIENTATION=-